MATIYYHDIGDYLSREQKLKMVHDFRSVKSMEWTRIVPNEKQDWINMRDGVFETMLSLAGARQALFRDNGPAISSGRDSWVYNYNREELNSIIVVFLDNYNSLVEKHYEKNLFDETQISWTANLKKYYEKNFRIEKDGYVFKALYRPFCLQWLYLNDKLLERPGITIKYRKERCPNIFMLVSKGGTKEMSAMLTSECSDYHSIGDTHVFPLYYYEKNVHRQKSLFDDTSDDDYIRHDGITDWILKEVRSRYNDAKNITKEMIFYYVYGLLHSKDYRERFAADLKKSLPRIPIVERIEDFMAFYKAGKQLAELHLNYEEVPPHPEVVVHITAQRADQDDYAYFRVDPKMKFRSKEDKSVILYNANIRLENIPLKAYDYIVNGKSAIEWIVERYCVSIDKKSLIKNDANDWAREHGKPRYILDLLLSVINVSTQTVDIVNNLPHLTFD